MAAQSFLPAFLASWIQLLVPQPCFDEFFVKFNFLHGPCLKIAVSKCLGFGIILGSCIVKLPQVIKIFRAKSGQGINLMSVTFELLAISASWAYGFSKNFPFSSYGEALFLAVQTSLIALLVLVYSGQTAMGLLYVGGYSAAMGFLLSPLAPLPLLTAFQASNAFIIAISKLIQAYENFKNSSTGQLSAVTVFLLFLGALARIFTSVQETGDSLVVFTYVISAFCNGIITAQMLYYWNSKPKVKQT